MARDISELGADVYDDTPKPQHKLSPKKRNYIIGLSITGVLLVGVVIGTVILCNTALTDYSNVRNVKYYYTPKTMLGEGEEQTAILYQLTKEYNPDDPKSYKYPSTFRIPSHVNGYKVVGVAPQAFLGHEEIKKVIMPNTIEFVGEEAFKNCTNLKTFTWSKNLTDVGINAFNGTKFYDDLNEQTDIIYDLPSGLCIYVGQDYFKPNTALISDNLTEQEQEAIKTEFEATEIVKFSDCKIKQLSNGIFKSNNNIVYVDLPHDQKEILQSTFEMCKNLKGFDASHSELEFIGDKAFNACNELKKVTLTHTVQSIGASAFAGTAIKEIPDISQVESFSEGVFSGCDKITHVDEYPLTYVPKEMFKGCTSLSSFTWKDEEHVHTIGISAFENTKFTKFKIPMNVLTISDRAFRNVKSLEKVSLYGNPTGKIYEGTDKETINEDTGEKIPPETYIDANGNKKNGILVGVKSIYASAFENCTALKTIDLYGDDGNHWKGKKNEFTFPLSLKYTDQYTNTLDKNKNNPFKGTQATRVIIGPNLTSIGSYAFNDAKNLAKVELDSSITDKSVFSLKNIESNAFSSCSSLESIELPSSVTSIKSSAFNGCRKLSEIKNFGNTQITSIEASVFKNCSSITHLDLPETVSAIKNFAFDGVTSLDYLIIPSEVTQIDQDTFINCRKTEDDEGNEIVLTDADKMPVYFDLTYAQAFDTIYNRNASIKLEDDTVNLFFLLGEDGKREEGKRYWNGDATNPQEI